VAGAPSLRAVAIATAIAVVGGSVPDARVDALAPISTDAPAAWRLAVPTGTPSTARPEALLAFGPGAARADTGLALEAPAGMGDPWAVAGAVGSVGSHPGGALLAAGAPLAFGRSAPRAAELTSLSKGPAKPVRKRELRKRWRVSRKVTWYGPGFYGNRTACGLRYTRYIRGVAHRTLPCGTMVQFRWRGRTAAAPVIDRGPYGHRSLVFDWSAWFACQVFRPKGMQHGCFTRTNVKYRVIGKVNLDKWFAKRKR
jgi:hypothetical protein